MGCSNVLLPVPLVQQWAALRFLSSLDKVLPDSIIALTTSLIADSHTVPDLSPCSGTVKHTDNLPVHKAAHQEGLILGRQPLSGVAKFCDAFLGFTVTSEFVVNHSSNSQRPGIPTEEGDPPAIQIPKCSFYVIQGSEQVGLVTCDPVQLQVQRAMPVQPV